MPFCIVPEDVQTVDALDVRPHVNALLKLYIEAIFFYRAPVNLKGGGGLVSDSPYQFVSSNPAPFTSIRRQPILFLMPVFPQRFHTIRGEAVRSFSGWSCPRAERRIWGCISRTML